MKMTFRNIIIWLIIAASASGCGSQKVSFAVMSDVHLMGGNTQQLSIIDSMIFLANNANKIIGDSVGKSVRKPFGLFVTGDLTDSGTPEAWNEFEEKFGLNGDGRLEMPVYETFGNHDGGVGGVVRKGISTRNTLRKHVIMTSDNGLHYAVEKSGHLFIVLGSYPGGKWDPECEWCHYFRESFREAEGSLDFLEDVLKKNSEGKNLPVFLFFHYGWDDFSGLWWTPAEQEKFFNTIQKSRVAGFFHGHNHQIDAYSWRGFDVFISGSAQREERAGELLLVSVSNGKSEVFVITPSRIRKLK